MELLKFENLNKLMRKFRAVCKKMSLLLQPKRIEFGLISHQ